MKTISIFGLGHVGLVNAVCFAKRGYQVIGIDTDPERLDQVQNARAPFFEPSLSEYLQNAIDRKLLLATDDASLNASAEYCFVAVGTPRNPDGSANLGQAKAAAEAIGATILYNPINQLVVILSTVPPGTARNIILPILESKSNKRKGTGFNLCSNPALFRQGQAIPDTENPSRIIIGGDKEAIAKLEAFYKEFCANSQYKILRTTYENAELIKYATNAYIATKISFINFIADIAEQVPFADVRDISKGIGYDERIGPTALNAGVGWGGPCLPKDAAAIAAFSQAVGLEPQLLQAVVAINDAHYRKASRIAKGALGSLRDRRIAILGLAFKPGTSNVIDAPSTAIIRDLLSQGAHVVAYDPKSVTATKRLLEDKIEYTENAIACIEGAHCCIISTEWDEFKMIRPQTFLEKMIEPIVIDGRGIYDTETFLKAGIRLFGIGIGSK